MTTYGRREIIKVGITAGLIGLSGCEGSFPRETEKTPTSTPKPMTPFDATEPEKFSKIDHQDLEQTIHRLVNDERRKHGLDSLGYNEELAYIARTKSRDMAVKGYFAHKEPDGDMYTDRLREYGYDWQHTSENLMKSFTEHDTPISEIAKRVVNGWMGSPPHREKILVPSFNVQGIGAYVNDDYTIYVTQIFDEILRTDSSQSGN